MAEEFPRTQLSNASEEFVTEALPVGWPWRLLVFSIVIFAFSLFVYIGLNVGYEKYLESRSVALDQSLDNLASQVGIEKQQQFVGIYSQLVNLKTVLGGHPYTSNAFKFLEANVIQTVYFTDATFRLTDNSLRVKGVTNNFDSAAAQVGMFEKATGVTSVLLSDVSIEQNGSIGFTVDIVFDPSFFSKPLSS